MKVWAYLYNHCVYESADGVVSLHMTKNGAEVAMQNSKHDAFIVWQEDQKYYADPTNGMLDYIEDEYVPKKWQIHSVKEMEVFE